LENKIYEFILEKFKTNCIDESENIENLQSLKFDILEEKLDDGEEVVDTRGTGGGMVEE
jgi:hypothetical protein